MDEEKQEVMLLDKKLLHAKEEEKEVPFWKRIAGLGFMLIILKNLTGGLNDILAKSMSDLHPITFILLRSVTMLSLVTPLCILRDQPPFPPGQSLLDRGLLLFRCVIGCIQASRACLSKTFLICLSVSEYTDSVSVLMIHVFF